MPDPQNLVVFFGASLTLALAPGPDILFVVAQSATHGRRAGLLVTAGLCTGLLGHTAVVAFGAGEVLARVRYLLPILKAIGAAYLCTLAWQTIRHAKRVTELQRPAPLSPPSLYRRGLVMNLTNPKVTLFFLAFLPQFVDPDAGEVAAQLVLLGALFLVAAALVFSTAANLAGGLAARVIGSARGQRALHYGGAAVLAGLAVRLLL